MTITGPSKYDSHTPYDSHRPYDTSAPSVVPFTPGPVDTPFYIATFDLWTDQLIAELPLTGGSFNTTLLDVGQFSGTVPVDSTFSKINIRAATQPARAYVAVFFNRALVWAGLIWGRTYDSSTGQLSIKAEDFGSFYKRQEISQNLAFKNNDQFDFVRIFIGDVASQPGGDIKMGVSSGESGVLRVGTYYQYDHKNTFDAMNELSQLENGFDWAFEASVSSTGRLQKILNLSYPMRGTPQLQSKLMFEFPGNASKYSWPEDASNLDTIVWALGQGDGANMLQATATIGDALGVGKSPRLLGTYSYKDTTSSTILQAQANAARDANGDVLQAPTFTLPVNGDPMLGQFGIGDYARCMVNDEFYPRNPDSSPGIDETLRIMDISVSVDDRTMTVSLAHGPRKTA